jgi:hypothetical protein
MLGAAPAFRHMGMVVEDCHHILNGAEALPRAVTCASLLLLLARPSDLALVVEMYPVNL